MPGASAVIDGLNVLDLQRPCGGIFCNREAEICSTSKKVILMVDAIMLFVDCCKNQHIVFFVVREGCDQIKVLRLSLATPSKMMPIPPFAFPSP